MKRLSYIGAAALSLLFLSCGNSKEVSDNEETEENEEIKKGIIITDWDAYQDNARVGFKSVSLEGDILTLDIMYAGGCEEHTFELLGSNDVLKSMPPKRGILLYHNSNGDSCRERIDETLKFDISEFSAGKKETIHLNLDGWEETIVYEK